MAKPRFVVVSNADKDRGTDPSEPDDPVFFAKRSVRLHTKIAHCGRLDPQSVWHVVKIESYTNFGTLSYSAIWRLAE